MPTTTRPETLFVMLPENVDELYNLIQQSELKADYFAQSHLLQLYLLYRRDENTHTEAMHEIKHAAIKYICSDR